MKGEHTRVIHTVFYVIIFFVALIVSNVINKVFPKLPLPLIQVVFGLILGMLGAGDVLRLNSELFLAFIIGPLLFREGEEADVKGIIKHGRTVTLLVFPVVFLTPELPHRSFRRRPPTSQTVMTGGCIIHSPFFG